MRVEIARLHRALGVTMVYVTHDQIEAMTLADRIVVLRAGKVEQVGTPTELYDRPANLFVAGFIGSPRMNFLTVDVVEAGQSAVTLAHPAFSGGQMRLARSAGGLKTGGRAIVGLRPEHLHMGGAPALSLVVDFSENLGGATQIYARPPGGDMITAVAPGRPGLEPGAKVDLSVDPAHVYLFTEDGLAL